MHAIHNFTILYIPFGIVVAISIWMLWYFRWLYKQYLNLQTSGITVNASVRRSKSFKRRGARMLRVEYEFRAADGEERQARCDLTFSEDKMREYGEGKIIAILYSPSGADSATYPTESLPDTLKSLERLNKIMPFMLLGNALMFYYILFYFHRPIIKGL